MPEIGVQQASNRAKVEHKRVAIKNKHDEELVGVLHETSGRDLVVICHGFRSSKDRLPMVNLAFAFEREGINAYRFDFAGNGESEGTFQYGNYHREAEDIRAVVEHFQREQYSIVALIGHSKGGNAALLYASKYNDIQTVVNIAGRFDLKRGIEGRLGKDFREKLDEHGFIDVVNRKGKFEYRVTKESLIDRLTTDTLASSRAISPKCRVLTVHSTTDELVPVGDAYDFDEHIQNHKLCVFEGADHEFTDHLPQLASVVVDFVMAMRRLVDSRL